MLLFPLFLAVDTVANSKPDVFGDGEGNVDGAEPADGVAVSSGGGGGGVGGGGEGGVCLGVVEAPLRSRNDCSRYEDWLLSSFIRNLLACCG